MVYIVLLNAGHLHTRYSHSRVAYIAQYFKSRAIYKNKLHLYRPLCFTLIYKGVLRPRVLPTNMFFFSFVLHL